MRMLRNGPMLSKGMADFMLYTSNELKLEIFIQKTVTAQYSWLQVIYLKLNEQIRVIVFTISQYIVEQNATQIYTYPFDVRKKK